VSIEYQLSGAVEEVAFGMGFSSVEGVRLMSLDSDLAADRVDLAEGGRGTVEATIPALNLQPGRYAIDLAARSGENGSLDYLPSCAWIDVLPGPNTPAVIIRDGGGVREPAAWNWNSEISST
jgi:lipopolysaccharide transport system ATP-binding protein